MNAELEVEKHLYCHRYGTRSIDLLKRYYQNELTDLSLDDAVDASNPTGAFESRAESNHHTSTSGRTGRTTDPTYRASANGGSAALHSETLAPRSALPPLLLNLGERPPEALQYLGTSFGLTQQLFSFWHRSGYKPVYVRQTASDVTGEQVQLTEHWIRQLRNVHPGLRLLHVRQCHLGLE